MRTVLSEQQLQTLRSVYASNPRPDALMKEHLVDVTGLAPKVIRVWFQNKRCKDKKKAIQQQQQAMGAVQGGANVRREGGRGKGRAGGREGRREEGRGKEEEGGDGREKGREGGGKRWRDMLLTSSKHLLKKSICCTGLSWNN